MGCLVVTRRVIALICLSESRLFYPLKRYQRYHEPYCGSWRSLLFRGSRWVSPLPFLDHGSAAKNFYSTDTIPPATQAKRPLRKRELLAVLKNQLGLLAYIVLLLLLLLLL